MPEGLHGVLPRDAEDLLDRRRPIRRGDVVDRGRFGSRGQVDPVPVVEQPQVVALADHVLGEVLRDRVRPERERRHAEPRRHDERPLLAPRVAGQPQPGVRPELGPAMPAPVGVAPAHLAIGGRTIPHVARSDLRRLCPGDLGRLGEAPGLVEHPSVHPEQGAGEPAAEPRQVPDAASELRHPQDRHRANLAEEVGDRDPHDPHAEDTGVVADRHVQRRRVRPCVQAGPVLQDLEPIQDEPTTGFVLQLHPVPHVGRLDVVEIGLEEDEGPADHAQASGRERRGDDGPRDRPRGRRCLQQGVEVVELDRDHELDRRSLVAPDLVALPVALRHTGRQVARHPLGEPEPRRRVPRDRHGPPPSRSIVQPRSPANRSHARSARAEIVSSGFTPRGVGIIAPSTTYSPACTSLPFVCANT